MLIVETDRGIGKSKPLKLVLMIGKILLENVTGMRLLEYGFAQQDEPNNFFATGKEPTHLCHGALDTYVWHLVPAVLVVWQQRGTTKKFSEFSSSK